MNERDQRNNVESLKVGMLARRGSGHNAITIATDRTKSIDHDQLYS